MKRTADTVRTSIVVGILAALGGFLYGSNKDSLKNKPFESSLRPEPSFVMSDNLSCTVKQSSDKSKIGVVLSLLGLETENPKMLSNDTGGTFPLTKLHESQTVITVGLIASGSGSTDVFIIDKKTGEFARTTGGIFTGIYADASKGTCK